MRGKKQEITKKLSLQIFLHGVIVTDKDISSKHLVPWKRLCGWQGLEPFVHCIVVVVINVVIAVVTGIFATEVVATVLATSHIANAVYVVFLVHCIHIVSIVP
jgi:hypothetical protein